MSNIQVFIAVAFFEELEGRYPISIISNENPCCITCIWLVVALLSLALSRGNAQFNSLVALLRRRLSWVMNDLMAATLGGI